jgi:FkbM family methyltransferase
MNILFGIRKLTRKLGIDLKYYPGAELGKLKKFFRQQRISLVLDVGANTGQYAVELRELGYKGRIVSFEPQQQAFDALQQKAANRHNWKVFHCALGEKKETATINIAANSASSSLLDMLPTHAESAPESAFVNKETITVERLDEIIDLFAQPNDRIFLKIDTQGFEEKVLNGASGCMNRVRGIQLEMSMVPLYDGEMLFDEMRKKIEGLGFTLCSILPGFSDAATGKLLQVDGIFFKV